MLQWSHACEDEPPTKRHSPLPGTRGHDNRGRRIRIHTIDVGQGAATLVEMKCGAMLIDTGAQDEQHVTKLTDYLTRFFELRPDLGNTLKSMVLTHCHKDHTSGLTAVARRFKVENFVYNGYTQGSGTRDLVGYLRYRTASSPDTKVVTIDDPISGQGYTSSRVDPFECTDCDPEVRILSGGRMQNTLGWSFEEFRDQNNHSVVVKVKLGESSYLVTGDMEEPALEALVQTYRNTSTLNADIVAVGHHGSRNGTTTSFLNAVSPRLAVVSGGHWDFGLNSRAIYTTWKFGHPNKGILTKYARAIPETRPRRRVKAGNGARNFVDYTVRKAIYSTAWDGHVVVDIFDDGRIEYRPSGI